MNIRPETPADYAAIAALHVRAFGQRTAEALVVTLLRQRVAFDPALSLVAEENGHIVGHVLFSARPLRLLGQDVRAVSLAPIAVDPAAQGRGIGGALIREGHALAQSKSYVLCLLLGHDTYYPRFGYQTHAYGAASLEAAVIDLPRSTLTVRDPQEADVATLRSLWAREEGDVDFASDPGGALLDWISPHPSIRAHVFEHDGQIVGFARVHSAASDKPRLFLAQDAEAARMIAAHLAEGAASLTLPLHPRSASTSAFGHATCSAWSAAMACSLAPNPFDDYHAQVRAGQRPPGRVIWGVEFDFT